MIWALLGGCLDSDARREREVAPATEPQTGTPPPLDERRRSPVSSDGEVREWTYDPSVARRSPAQFPER